MNSSPQDQEVLPLGDCNQTIRDRFIPVWQRLQSTLELSRSLAAVLQGNDSLARHFNVPLAGDMMAKKIDHLFSKLHVVEDDEGEVDTNICWLDIVLAPTYRPTRREDGCYYLQVNGHRGWVKIAESDHRIIDSGLLGKLIDPCSYPKDVQSEEETMRLVEGLLSALNKLASQS
ncbi:hypothetical protein BDW69DRAFT_198675 [Aspergillus filifer]